MTVDLADTDSRQWVFHGDRLAVVAEPHARPSLPIGDGEVFTNLCMKCVPEAEAGIFAIFDLETTAADTRHWLAEHKGVRIKIEKHTEFLSLSLLGKTPASQSTVQELLNSLSSTPGCEVITLTRVETVASMNALTKCLPFGDRFFGGTILGNIEVRSTLTPDDEGFITYFACLNGVSPNEAGRSVQQLVEMETYRTMGLLGLPEGRRAGALLGEFEHGLSGIVSSLNRETSDSDRMIFDQLSELMQQTHQLLSNTRFRFSASQAYFDLALERIRSISEVKCGDLQTISDFVRSRLDPAMATINSVRTRQDTLIDDLNNALTLLRTRIDLEMSRDNQSLLKSMDSRHRQQLLIAQTVEGLSAVAITYYAVGLLSYIIKPVAAALPWDVSYPAMLAVSVPLVLTLVWMSLHRLRSKWKKTHT